MVKLIETTLIKSQLHCLSIESDIMELHRDKNDYNLSEKKYIYLYNYIFFCKVHEKKLTLVKVFRQLVQLT